MSRYGSHRTIGSAAMLDKERIIHALKGELVVGEDKHGFIYEQAPWHECEDFILSAFDNQVHQCKGLAAAGRAYERLYRDKGWKYTLPEFLRYYIEELKKFKDDYAYESEVRDFMEGLEDGPWQKD